MKKNNAPLTKREKQTKPMLGEVASENARAKAAQYAAKERHSIRSKKPK